MGMAIQGLLPLIVFAIVDIFAGMRAAIIAAMVFALAEAVWSWQQFGEVDNITWLSLGLIVAMGIISMRMQDVRLFKFQPVAMALIIAGVLSWFQLKGSPLMVQMMPKVAALLPEEQRWTMSDPTILKQMARLDLLLIPTFLAHAALVAWAALHKSTLIWIVARGVGFYVLMFGALAINFMLPMK